MVLHRPVELARVTGHVDPSTHFTGNGCGPHPTVTIDNVHAGSIRSVFVELGKPPLRSLRHEVLYLSIVSWASTGDETSSHTAKRRTSTTPLFAPYHPLQLCH